MKKIVFLCLFFANLYGYDLTSFAQDLVNEEMIDWNISSPKTASKKGDSFSLAINDSKKNLEKQLSARSGIPVNDPGNIALEAFSIANYGAEVNSIKKVLAEVKKTTQYIKQDQEMYLVGAAASFKLYINNRLEAIEKEHNELVKKINVLSKNKLIRLFSYKVKEIERHNDNFLRSFKKVKESIPSTLSTSVVHQANLQVYMIQTANRLLGLRYHHHLIDQKYHTINSFLRIYAYFKK